MKHTLVLRFGKQIAAVLVLMVAAQMSEAAVLQAQEPASSKPAQQQSTAQQQAPAQSGDQQTAKSGADIPQAPDAEPGFASHSQDAQPQDVQKPVGTAAGPYTRPSGVAGSRPAGAAIAPSKQKRKKALMIRVGLIVGGAVAVGTVAGLSMASSSRP
ncbi:hypothetical protein [Occallatibacter riparius]|uniref:Translation initiation factor 2 n=1 Tax=Occallatibacter riparius TaxID=1002689 RepID=A0A9J7BM03_9BACT|nr:hypothetical protein [Occallatibacter riparius]UWZ83916.1 hypothetical protein MOP44_25580 [Occallatibacter riparius]